MALEEKSRIYQSCIGASPGGEESGAGCKEELSSALHSHHALLTERQDLLAEFSYLQQALRRDGAQDHCSAEISYHNLEDDRADSIDESFSLDPLVAMWLKQLGLLDLSRKFALECIDRASLSLLSHSQLQELGVVKMGDRTKLLRRATQSRVR